MMNLPDNLKKFNSLFLQLEGIRHKINIDTLFSDFLSFLIIMFCINNDDNTELINKYNEKEKNLFNELIREFLFIHNDAQKKYTNSDFKWFDFLGVYYEFLASKYNKKALGQFFTPAPLCDLMAKLHVFQEKKKVITINDPACGSGRNLLSVHCQLKGNCIMFAEDLDEICVKMTVINFLIHGVQGEVIHHDSLDLDSFFSGYYVNRYIKSKYLPTVQIITQEGSLIMNRKKENKKEPVIQQQVIDFIY